MLKSHQLGVAMQGGFFVGKAGSHYVMLLYCETLLQVLLSIYCKRFYQYLFSLYYCCFMSLRLTRPKVQLKVS